MKKQKKRPEIQKGLMIRITALVLGIWLPVMGLLTWAVAQDFYRQMESEIRLYCQTDHGIGMGKEYAGDLPGLAEIGAIHTTGAQYSCMFFDKLLPIVRSHVPNGWGSDDWIWGKWDLLYGYEAAVLFESTETHAQIPSGNYVYFAYTDDASWQAQNVTPLGFAYMDLDRTEGCMDAFDRLLGDEPYGDMGIGLLIDALRLTGYFEGNAFIPTHIDRGMYVWDHADDIKELCKRDSMGQIEWEVVFASQQKADQELVTIYGWDLGGIRSDFEPVTVENQQYDDLTDLLSKRYYTKRSLWDAVFVHPGKKVITVNRVGTEYDFTMAVHCWPMGYAAWRMIPCYVVSLALAVFVILCFRRRIRRSIVVPLENAILGFNQGLPAEPWHEAQALLDKRADDKEAIYQAQTENKQLRTALEYAKDAEEKRRRLISDLTHELKTPLAIIHGYAEGLKSGIAQEKKERYLDIILEESERMDAMVLQMLDLSRLEAGKVRLSADTFSLLELTKGILEKFSLAMEEKELRLTMLKEEDFFITADEERIRQVVTNLVSNAVKYAEPGGNIRIWISRGLDGAKFEIENTSQPLTSEQMEKIFDSFYRVDASRTEPGTGLGLAIVKSIVELHRGTCTVRNRRYTNETCVSFYVNLPLS